MQDGAEVQRIVETGAVEQFRMDTVGTAVSNARNSGSECVAPQDWPQMQEQGRIRYGKEQLRWLRTAPGAEIDRELTGQLDDSQAAQPTKAEKRLWVRELMDRDDAETLQPVIDRIRGTLREVKLLRKDSPKSQGDLF